MVLTQPDFDHAVHQTGSPDLPEPYRGKVRDVYPLADNHLAIVATDRISAFDHILNEPVPYKGQILNLMAAKAFESASSILPTHLIDLPHPNVMIAQACQIIPVEVIVRGYLAGHSWREYENGKRQICGNQLPEGLVANQKLPEPIITPTTKAHHGHDTDLTEQQIIDEGIIPNQRWQKIKEKAFKLFELGTRLSAQRGLILVDTKYEFGFIGNRIVLADEVHTPDSSRFFYSKEYKQRLKEGKPQKQLSKEFVREWLVDHGFSGKTGEDMPELSRKFREEIYRRYTEIFMKMTGEQFEPVSTADFNKRLPEILKPWL